MTPLCLPSSFSASPSPVFGMYCHFSARTGSFPPAKRCSGHLLQVILDKPHLLPSLVQFLSQLPELNWVYRTRHPSHTQTRAHISGLCVHMCVCNPCGLSEGCHVQTTFKLCGECGIEQGTKLHFQGAQSLGGKRAHTQWITNMKTEGQRAKEGSIRVAFLEEGGSEVIGAGRGGFASLERVRGSTERPAWKQHCGRQRENWGGSWRIDNSLMALGTQGGMSGKACRRQMVVSQVEPMP